MYVCTYTHIYVYVYIHTHTLTHSLSLTHTHTYTSIQIYTDALAARSSSSTHNAREWGGEGKSAEGGRERVAPPPFTVAAPPLPRYLTATAGMCIPVLKLLEATYGPLVMQV